MQEEKITYMQMIQQPIGRMSTASAIFKGFAATIVAGVSKISYSDVNVWVILLSFLPVLSFAALDLYYLRTERRFRHLYEQVRKGLKEIDFSLGLDFEDKAAKSRIIDCIKSPSIWLFYPLAVIILIIVFILKLMEVI